MKVAAPLKELTHIYREIYLTSVVRTFQIFENIEGELWIESWWIILLLLEKHYLNYRHEKFATFFKIGYC